MFEFHPAHLGGGGGGFTGGQKGVKIVTMRHKD